MSGAAAAAGWADWSIGAPLGWCAIAGAVHEAGRRRLRRELPPGRVVGRGQVACFWAGLAVVAAALASPLEAAAHQLFSMHMIQHLLLSLVAPLLLAAAAPSRVMSRSLPVGTRRVVLRATGRAARRAGIRRTAPPTALAAVGLHVLALAVWHVPAAYESAAASAAVHAVEHASLFATGLLFWWVVTGVRWQHRSGLAIVYLFLTGLPMGALAALITLAPAPLYDSHLDTVGAWGLSALEDQQLAGAIMWVPGGVVYLGAAVVLFVRWLDEGPAPGEQELAWHG